MNKDKCEFCKGTGKEPGEPGCVWCHNTGTKAGQALLTPPAQQHQGEPVGTLTIKVEGSRTSCDFEWAGGFPKLIEGDYPLYTHADPAEVERLRTQLHDLAMAMHKRHYAKTAPDFEPFDFASGLIGQIDNMVAGILQDVSTLRADVETMRRKNNEYWHESEAMRAQLAEAQALLGDIKKYLTNNEVGGYERLLCRKIDALSASAEPSAPVEIDERAEFEAWFKDHSKDWPFPSESIKCIARDNDWLVWQARAALEREP